MKRVINLIIVDESGSMSIIERQAVAGMQETLNTIAKTQELHPDMEQRVTLITFNSDHRRYLLDNVPATQANLIPVGGYRPSSATPLYDAIGEGVSRINAQCSPEDNVLVTIITDGEENCSTEWNLQMVKTLIEKLKKQNWTFTLIGTDNLDVHGMAASMAINHNLSFAEDADGTIAMFKHERASRVRYYDCIARDQEAPDDYFAEDK